MIDIAVLGTGAMMPSATQWLSSFLVRIEDELILFDAGEGVQIPWRTTGWGMKRLSIICLSHCHADHIAGLPGVLHALANAGREEPITIIGPRGTRFMVSHLRKVVPLLPFDVRVADLADGQSWHWNDVRISVVAGIHRVPVLIFRFDLPRKRAFLAELATDRGIPRHMWSQLAVGNDVIDEGGRVRAEDFLGPERPGVSFGVMTDTRPFPAAVGHLQGVDLLIAEGTYGDDADILNAVEHRHMTFREVAKLAQEIDPGELILTHFSQKMIEPSAWLQNATDIFPKTRLAKQGMVFRLNFPAAESG